MLEQQRGWCGSVTRVCFEAMLNGGAVPPRLV
jgi:hypothetical protein